MEKLVQLEQKKEITLELDDLAMRIDRLEKLIAQLYEKLEPIRKQSPVATPKESNKANMSPMGNYLQLQNSRLEKLNEMIANLLDELAI